MTHWDNPCIIGDDGFDAVWAREAHPPVLFVMGIGFDARACVALKRLLGATNRRVDLLLLELPVDSTDPNLLPLVAANRSEAEALIRERGGDVLFQELPSFTDHGSVGRLVSRAFQDSGHLQAYTEVIIDVSAMPRSVYFALVRGILERAHSKPGEMAHWSGDLHVTVCENPAIDALVLEEGTRPMAAIGGFARPRNKERPKTVIWVPVIGERSGPRIAQLHADLRPDETCPVLPWPSRDPRRSDRLVLENRDLFFQTIRLEPRNIIHASEWNPFDLHRSIGELHTRYTQALEPLGTVGMVLSSHSSKLLSVGVLLAAYEFDLEVQHVSPATYSLHGDPGPLVADAEIYDIWLTGEPYEKERP